MQQRFWSRIAAATATLLLVGVGIIAGVGLSIGTGAAPAHADLDDFVIESFDAEYELSRDSEGRSSLITTEHIVAVFPDFDQNRGLIRDLTRVYDGHGTDIEVRSVTDETGAPRDYTTEPYGNFLAVVMAVPEGSFVHGAQHYVIEYAQRDVTRFFADTGADEFYWDINGTGWSQPFGRVSARITLDESLAQSLNGDVACYRGTFGVADQPCAITGPGDALDGADTGETSTEAAPAETAPSETGAEAAPVETEPGEGTTEETPAAAETLTFFVEETGLEPQENITIALGFEPGTFTAAPTPPVPPQPFLQRFPILLWGGLASLAAAAVAFVTALVRGRGAKTGRAIIAQYEPPADVNLAVSAELLKARKKTMTATLLDLAVRRKLRLLHQEEDDRYGIQALDSSGLDSIDKVTYAKIFGGSSEAGGVEPGKTHWFSRSSTRLGDAAASLIKRAKDQVKGLGLRKANNVKAIVTVALLMVIALALPVLHAVLLGNFVLMTVLLAVGINVLVWSLIGMAVILSLLRPVTHEGALLLDHLKGLREYIRLAEADRIRMLQSASGAEVDEHFIVQVYERLLPYAVLFGFEKEWQSELAKFYRESPPDWVAGSGRGSTSFLDALPLASFAHTVTTSPKTVTSSSGSGSGSSFSSSSGGSSGGGFSGGGGGGGGGRGI